MKQQMTTGDKDSGKKRASRPYVRDAGRKSNGPLDTVTVTGGMVVLALAVGFVLGIAVVMAMRLSARLTNLVWNGYLDGVVQLAWFPLVICTAGGIAIGLWTRYTGDHVRPLHEVMAEFKKTGTYHVHPVKGTVSFLLPLVFGGSVGFEAGLTGLATAGCCWMRDQLKKAGLRVGATADVSVAASLSAIFGAPFAGIVAGAESSPADEEPDSSGPDSSGPDSSKHDGSSRGNSEHGESDRDGALDPARYDMRRGVKLVLYTAAAFGAFAGMHCVNILLGATSGLPHMGGVEAQGTEFFWGIAAILAAYALTWVYHGSRRLFSKISNALGNAPAATVAKPVIAGIVIGALACVLPYVLFPGEEQAHMLMASWTGWTAAALIGTGMLKAALTPLCIEMGWVGGNFFPSIFAGIAVGYGLSILTGADPMLMVTITATAFLGGVTRKPLITVALMFLVFPVESVVWMGLAGSRGNGAADSEGHPREQGVSMSLFSKKSKAESSAKPKFEDRLDINNNHYPILGHRGHGDLDSVINDFAEGTHTIYDLNFVCGLDLEGKKGRKKLEQGRQNFGAMGAKKVYLVEDCCVFGGCKRGFIIADDGIYFVDEDGEGGHYDWRSFDAATLTYSYEKLSIDEHEFITQQAQMLGSLLESLQKK